MSIPTFPNFTLARDNNVDNLSSKKITTSNLNVNSKLNSFGSYDSAVAPSRSKDLLVIQTTSQTIPTTVSTTITPTIIAENESGSYNSTTGVYTTKSAGGFIITGAGQFQNSAAGTERRITLIAGAFTFQSSFAFSAGNDTRMNISATLNLPIGQPISIRVFQDSGGNLGISAMTFSVKAL